MDRLKSYLTYKNVHIYIGKVYIYLLILKYSFGEWKVEATRFFKDTGRKIFPNIYI